MPGVEWYGASDDAGLILDALFREAGIEVWEADSRPDEPVRHPTTAAEAHGIDHLMVRALGSGPEPIFRRVGFADGAVPGATHRFTVEGWGLIAVHLPRTLPDGRAGLGRISHNTRARAERWSATYPEFGPVDAWDWREIAALGRRLTRAVQVLEVARDGRYAVLPGAASLREQ